MSRIVTVLKLVSNLQSRHNQLKVFKNFTCWALDRNAKESKGFCGGAATRSQAEPHAKMSPVGEVRRNLHVSKVRFYKQGSLQNKEKMKNYVFFGFITLVALFLVLEPYLVESHQDYVRFGKPDEKKS